MRRAITSYQDLEEILELIEPLIGEQCIEASLSFGTELYLEFKQKTAGRLADWTITTRASNWYVKNNSTIILTSDEEYAILEEKVQRLVGKHIVGLNISFETLSLTIQFNNQEAILIDALQEEDECEVTDWRVFTPNNMLIEVGSGHFWNYVSVEDI